jgi:hypothetical protein
MRLFNCPCCSARLVFQNTNCLSCGAAVAWDQARGDFTADAPFCANRDAIDCNWPASEPGALCRACAMTATIPDTFTQENVRLWAEAERAKRRVLATLGRWGWFHADDSGPPPSFHMLSEATRHGERNVTMAHDCGEITINVTEADLAERVERGLALGEKLRTMNGHFRHEIAHFLFERLRPREGFIPAFRELMGDESADYPAALQRHYDQGPPQGWEADFVTEYAAAHPHEDWAETVAHLLHLTDLADSFVSVQWPDVTFAQPGYDPYAEPDADKLIEFGAEISMGANHLTRSVGLMDVYPFVLTATIRKKLAFAHRWLQGR